LPAYENASFRIASDGFGSTNMISSYSRVRAVLDTDTFNEVDDQFALAHLLLSPNRVELEAAYATPFSNARSSGPEDGMEKSYQEICRVLEITGTTKGPKILRGSRRFLEKSTKPVESEAVSDLIDRAIADPSRKLYVLGIGAATNLASALLIQPKIAENIVIVWLGGHAPYWPNARDFNLDQDPLAARVLFDSAVPMLWVPCYPVTSHLITTVAELDRCLAPYSKLGAYLTEIVRRYAGDPIGWSKNIWDIAVSAWLINPEWVQTREIPSPILKDDFTWETDPFRRPIHVATRVDRDAIFADFFRKASKSLNEGVGIHESIPT
jgi:purine nucleosidase